MPHAEADRFMQAVGHQPDSSLLGIVTGETDKHGWMAILRTTNEGYVKDEDAKDLDPAKLLENLRQGAEESNKLRVERGFAPLILDDWMQPPAYDAQTKRLVWALPVRTPHVALLKQIDDVSGHRYADFNPSTDKVAAYGLAALVGAVALKKLGLFAIAGAFVAKFAKVGIIAIIGLFAAIKAFFSRRKSQLS